MPALMEVQIVSDTTQPSPAAERMRLHRERKKNGMRCLMIELRETEINALIRKGFLKTDTRIVRNSSLPCSIEQAPLWGKAEGGGSTAQR
jgi:hypothetical protein